MKNFISCLLTLCLVGVSATAAAPALAASSSSPSLKAMQLTPTRRPPTVTLPVPVRKRTLTAGALDIAPVTQKVPLLVVAVAFSDAPAAVPLKTISDDYFGSSDSVASYFADQSYGIYKMSGTVIGGAAAGQKTADLILPHPASYYAKLGDQGGVAIASDATSMLEAAGFNFGPYTEGTKVPAVVFCTSEPDPAMTGSSTPMAFYSTEYEGYDVKAGNVAITGFDIVSQTDPLGVLAHEFGHLLGLVDVYNASNEQPVVGAYSLYSDGVWLGDPAGSLPSSIGPWQKILLGWIQPTVISQSGNYSLPAVETKPQADAIWFPSANEVFLLENRERIGWDGDIPGAGLLIWKIDLNVASPDTTYWRQDIVDTPGGSGPSHDGIVLVTANGSNDVLAADGSSGDPFPGAQDVTTFSDATTPSAALLNGQPSGISISHISAAGPVMTFSATLPGSTAALSLSTEPHPTLAAPLTFTATMPGAVSGTTVTLTTPWGETKGAFDAQGQAALTVTPTTVGAVTVTAKASTGQTASLTADVRALPYTDVPAGAYYAKDAGALYAAGFFDGIPGFGPPDIEPSKPLTRAQFTALLLKALGITAIAPSPFADVPPSYWDAGQIGEAAQLGLVNGFTKESFRPDAPLTRAQAAKMLALAFKLKSTGLLPHFVDVPKDAWYAPYIALMWEHGYLKGVDTKHMEPSAILTRAQDFAVLERVIEGQSTLPAK